MAKSTSETVIKHTIVGLRETERLATATTRLAKAYDSLVRSMRRLSTEGAKSRKVFSGLTGSVSRARQSVSSLNEKVKQTTRNLARLSEKTEQSTRHTKAFGVTWQGVARIILASVIARAIGQLIKGLTIGIDKVQEFHIRISEMRTIAQDNQRTFGEWSEAVRQLSDQFGSPIIEVAEAHYQTLSNQIAKGAEVTEFAAEANKLAIVTTATLDEAVLALSGTLNAYGKDSSYAEEESAKLFKTIELGRLRLSELAPTIGRVAIIASQLGIKSEELYAAIDTLTIKGMRANEAMSGLRVVFMKLIRPTTAMQELFESWGVSSGEAAIQTFGFTGVLRKLSQAASATGSPLAEMGKLINRIRGTTAATGLVAKESFAQYERSLAKVVDGMGDYENAIRIGLESPGRRLRIELNKITNIFVKDIGGTVVASLVLLTEKVGGLANVVRTLLVAVKELAVFGILYLANIAIPRLLLAIVSLRVALAALKASFVWLLAHPAVWLAAVAYAAYKITEHFLNMNEKIDSSSKEVVTRHQEHYETLANQVATFYQDAARAAVDSADKQVSQLARLLAGTKALYNQRREATIQQIAIEKGFLQHLIDIHKGEKKLNLLMQRFKDEKEKVRKARIDRDFEKAEEHIANMKADIKTIAGMKDIMTKAVGPIMELRGGTWAVEYIDGAKVAKKLTKELTNEWKLLDKEVKKFGDYTSEADVDLTKHFAVFENQVSRLGAVQEGMLSLAKTGEHAAHGMMKDIGKATEMVLEFGRSNKDIWPEMILGMYKHTEGSKALHDSFYGLVEAGKELKVISKDAITSNEIEAAAEWSQKLQDSAVAFENLNEQAGRVVDIPEKFVQQIKDFNVFIQSAKAQQDQAQAITDQIAGMSKLYDEIYQKMIPIQQKFADLLSGWTGVSSAMQGDTAALGALLATLATQIEGLIIRLGVALQEQLRLNAAATGKDWTGGYMKRFAAGGSVGSDTIPSLLSPGEFVMNAKSVRKFLPQLVAMNSGAARFNEGGVTNNNVGDINVTVEGGDTADTTVRRIGEALRRELRRGTIRLN